MFIVESSDTEAVPAGEAVASTETVTIVIVCFNQARFLGEAIDSALKQTWRAQEIIIVDDGSTDQTREVALAYPVRYVYQRNLGLAAARNRGLEAATSFYITFLDADDRLLPNAIKDGIECFHAHRGSAFVYGAFRNVDRHGAPALTPSPSNTTSDHYRHLLQGNFIGMHGTVIYRRDILEETGGFDTSLKACEDYELYMRIARNHPVQGHAAVVAEYRKHESNMSRNSAFMLNSVLRVLAMQRRFIREPLDREAYRNGVRVWREYYGLLLLEEWRTEPTFRNLMNVARAWPVGVAKRMLAFAGRRVRLAPVRFGSLRRTHPFSRRFGFERGKPIDRHYIETFLSDHANDVHGYVLEVGDDAYSRSLGARKVVRQEVLHVVPGYPAATIIADLANAPQLRPDDFDCIILTQTLHYIFDVRAAVATLHRILRPGGVVLATLPGISAICRDQEDKESDCWRFTVASGRRLFAKEFGEANVSVQSYGNVLAAVSFLEGLAAEDLKMSELDYHDPDYQVTIAVRAVKKT
jgi:glycosyltransferase involved in cell wall biosynthesis